MIPDRDLITQVLTREGVDAALGEARASVDALLWRRDVRSNAAEVAAASVLRGGRDSAAIDGADIATPDDSPMGRMLEAALRVTSEAAVQARAWSFAPLQAIAHLHTVVAVGQLPPDAVGRPRAHASPDDPLHVGSVVPADEVSRGLTALGRWVPSASHLPALLVAALVHAELMHLQPFAWGSGLVVRASARCVLIDRGVDPSMFSIPELGMLELGRPAYVQAIREYRRGDVEGVAASLLWFASAVQLGAHAVP